MVFENGVLRGIGVLRGMFVSEKEKR